ncbi:PH domain-containing protein [Owenweeksia hongkongensis]|uniref:PH domain-containing protein n=1 Tax=Owenweeksia hongkongensis TaxID=253245 RepID=UPI003A956E5C
MRSTATLDKFAKIATVFIFLLLLFILYQILNRGEEPVTIYRAIIDSLLFFVAVFCFFYSTKGYSIHSGKLVIERPIGKKVISLNKLKGIYDYQKIEKGFTIRTFGNGGLFGYFGYYSNDKIGRFKLYSTKRKDFYILDFGKEKIGISPDQPEFIEALKGYVSKPDAPQS